jgi:acetylornithine deacetylase
MSRAAPNPVIQIKRLRHLLKRLIDIYSPSGKEGDVSDYLFSFLKRHDLAVRRQNVDDNRDNILVIPDDQHIELAFVGHLDTVPAYELEEFGYEEDGDELFGLGTADMKSGCAAMVEAYLAAAEAGCDLSTAALCFVVGEEEEGDGARKLMRDYDFPWAIIGEPTNLQPCLNHYGYLEVQIVTRGKRKHASLAGPGENAVETMLQVLSEIVKYLGGNRAEAVYNIRDLTSSNAGFVVPDHCEAWLDVHLPPTAPMGEITLELEETLSNCISRNGSPDAHIRFPTIHTGYEIPDRGPMIDLLRTIWTDRQGSWSPESFRSHSDANLLWMAGVKPVLFGPGRLEKAHVEDESVSFDQVCKAATLYADILCGVCSGRALQPGAEAAADSAFKKPDLP